MVVMSPPRHEVGPPRVDVVLDDPMVFPFPQPEEVRAPPRLIIGSRFRDWQRPSTSGRPVVHHLSREEFKAYGPTPKSRGQELMAARIQGNHESRTHFPLNADVEGLLAIAEDRVLGCRGDSRSNALSGRWKGYMAFNGHYFHPEDPMDHSLKILIYLELKMQIPKGEQGHLDVSSAHKYSKDLKQMVYQTGGTLDELILADYQTSLKKSGALLSQHQADPASRADVLLAMTYLNESEAVGLMVAWLTSSRIGEMAHLRGASFARKGTSEQHLWAITFPYHKGDPYRLGTCIPIHLGAMASRIEAHLATLRPEDVFTTLTTARAAAALDRAHPGLTAHSVKRGALVTMLMAGVPLATIQLMAKHKDLETLLAYLPRAEVALAMGVEEGSKAL